MSAPSKRAAVTGASGFVGGHIVAFLLSRAYSVVALVRDASSPSLAHLQHLSFLYPNCLTLAEVPDLTVPSDALSAAFSDCDAVHHVANPIGSSAEGLSEADFVSLSVELVENVLNVAAKCGVRRVVLTSSMAAVCGTQTARNPAHVFTEADWNDECGSRYSAAKTRSEQAAWAMAERLKSKDLSLTVINPSLVLGPTLAGQSPRSSNAWLARLADGEWKTAGGLRPAAFGTVHALDVAEAHVIAAEREDAAGQRYLATMPDQYSSLELAGAVRKYFPFLGAPEEYAQGVPADAVRVGRKPSSCNDKITALLGRPLRTLDSAVVDGVCAMIVHGFVKPKL